jgi:hypothetical protein
VDTPQLGRCHAPVRSRRRTSDGDGRHSKAKSDPTVDSDNTSQPAVARDPTPPVGRHRPRTQTITEATRDGPGLGLEAVGPLRWSCVRGYASRVSLAVAGIIGVGRS